MQYHAIIRSDDTLKVRAVLFWTTTEAYGKTRCVKEYGLTDENLHYIQLDEAAAANIDMDNGYRLHLRIETAVLSNPLSLCVGWWSVIHTFFVLWCGTSPVNPSSVWRNVCPITPMSRVQSSFPVSLRWMWFVFAVSVCVFCIIGVRLWLRCLNWIMLWEKGRQNCFPTSRCSLTMARCSLLVAATKYVQACQNSIANSK